MAYKVTDSQFIELLHSLNCLEKHLYLLETMAQENLDDRSQYLLLMYMMMSQLVTNGIRDNLVKLERVE